MNDAMLVDEGLMRQMVTNLMQNALNALSEARSQEPEISLLLSHNTADDIMLTLQDNGPGFPDGDLDKLFEPYMTTRDSGTGLGLAIVQKIVDDHNGQITLSNRFDDAGKKAGATVTITLPADRGGEA